MPPHGHEDESHFEHEVLVKRIKKIKSASKHRSKQIQIRSKKCAKAQAEKERQAVQKSPKSPIKRGQLSVLQHDQQSKFPKQQTNTTICVQHPKSVQSMQKLAEVDIKSKMIFQTRLSPASFDPYSVILYIATDKKIKITPMDVHLTLAFPIGGRQVETFYGKKSKDPKYNEVLLAWRKEWNLQDGTLKLSQMPQYIQSQAEAGDSFKRNFALYTVSCFFNVLPRKLCYFVALVLRVVHGDMAKVYGLLQCSFDEVVEERAHGGLGQLPLENALLRVGPQRPLTLLLRIPFVRKGGLACVMRLVEEALKGYSYMPIVLVETILCLDGLNGKPNNDFKGSLLLQGHDPYRRPTNAHLRSGGRPQSNYPPETLGPQSPGLCANTRGYQRGLAGSLASWPGPHHLRPSLAPPLAGAATTSFRLHEHPD
ncbi:hypothetical protein Cgig2_027168 [Carnegiea gigantea]|uniref:Uncharacterized protein n=1 Tax=Carnegiea gigantea TaxID=171969 RepID=A0A9Q1KUP7_9CARY|nr:hypothetical protein Cgig2_027168 [Carnegiea gigantea]